MAVVTFLLSKGANINYKNAYGETAAEVAKKYGYIPVAQYLMSKGSEQNSET